MTSITTIISHTNINQKEITPKMKHSKTVHLSLFALLCSVIVTGGLLTIPSDTSALSISYSCSTSITGSLGGGKLAKASTTCKHGMSFRAHPHSGTSKSETQVGSSKDSSGGSFSWSSYWWGGQSAPSGCDSIGSISQSASAKAKVSTGGTGCSSVK